MATRLLGLMLIGVVAAGAADEARRPAVLFVGASKEGCGYEGAKRLEAAGFAIGAVRYPGLLGGPLTWDQVKGYNVLVVTFLGMANADLTLTANNRATIDTLNRFLQAGGGIFYLCQFGQQQASKPPQDAFLGLLGLTPTYDEMPLDAGTEVSATAWKIPFAYTDRIEPAPVGDGVKGLWYPVPPHRIGAQNHATALKTQPPWQVVVTGSRSSRTVKGELQEASPTQPGTWSANVPLMAVREVGRGRLACLGLTPEYLVGAHAETTLEAVVVERGLRGVGSGGWKLLENSLKWLAEPSLTGETGGAKTDPELLRNPHLTRFGVPWDWSKGVQFPGSLPARRGVIGARTAASTGQGTVAEWVAAAKAAGLSFLVFLEDFGALTPGEFEQSKKDCAAASSAEFAAIPGFTIDDEVGNHYFYFGTTFPYPDAKFLSLDGKVFRSRDPALGKGDPYVPGQLAMTTLDYAYSLASFKLTCGNYLFSRDSAPFANFFSNWDAMGVICGDNGQVVEDSTREYLELIDFGNGPLPLVIDRVDRPSALAGLKWRTVLRLPPGGGPILGNVLRPDHLVDDYFNGWYLYPDNPSRIYVTSGPEIELWGYTGQRDYGGDNRGDFVWQNYRWPLTARITSAVGLREVVLYDGTEVFRRYLPEGAKEYSIKLDLSHDQQHNLVLVATDTQGGKAVSGEQWDRNHRLEEFMCGDRNNQLSYGYQTAADGVGTMLGGNQTLATPNKRIRPDLSPAGMFKNDALLGAPAFDGAAWGEPYAYEQVVVFTDQGEVHSPTVCESSRLFHTGDVHIGQGVLAHRFTDGIQAPNVWHTLWRTEPATDLNVTIRNHAFQIDPDSPLAAFLWRIEIKLLKDLPNRGILIATAHYGDTRMWAARGSDGAVYSGAWEDTPLSARRHLSVPLDRGGYVAYLDSPLGGGAFYSLTDGLQAGFPLPSRSQLRIQWRADKAPRKAGDVATAELLLLGIPRATSRTAKLPSASTEVVERFGRELGVLDGQPAYQVAATAGTVTGQRYFLDIDGAAGQCFSGKLTGKLIARLPVRVAGLNDRWSALLYDRKLKQARPIGVFERRAWATVVVNGERDLFVGHPLVADNPELRLQMTQAAADGWVVEAHNPTDQPMTVTLTRNPAFDPLTAKPFGPETVTIPAGSSVWREL